MQTYIFVYLNFELTSAYLIKLYTKSTMTMIDKRCTFIVIVLLTCWIPVISKATLGNTENRKFQDISPGFIVLFNKLQHIESKVILMDKNGKCSVSISTFFGIK